MRKECGSCKYNKRDWDHSEDFYCENEESENYGASTFYDDTCSEWEKERIGGYMMKNFDEFYPTPESLFEIATEGCDFKRIETILEPSAGKGDIVEYLQKRQRKTTWNMTLTVLKLKKS